MSDDPTVIRPREPQPEPQPEPPAGAISDGDDDPGETQPLRADAPPPPPPPGPASAVVPDPGATASSTTMVATTPQTATFGGFGGPGGEPPAQGGGTIEPEFPLRASRAGSAGAVVAIGTGLLAAAVVIAGFRARSDGDLDWSNYGVALGATAVLLVIALLGAVSGRKVGGRAREEVVTWPGAVGILATALVIGIGIDSDDSWVAYLIGAVMVVLAALGYVAARRAAFVVVAILGLVLVYGVAFDDFVADSVGDGHPQVTGAVLVAVFVVVVTLLGWALPSRAVSGVVVGAFGLAGLVGILVSFIVMRYFGSFLGGMPGFTPDFSGGGPEEDSSFFAVAFTFSEGDVWWVVAIAALLVALWALAAAVSNHSGFTILAIAGPAVLVPLASVAVAAEHPTWWAAILAVAGGVLLLVAAGLARLRGRRTAGELHGERTV